MATGFLGQNADVDAAAEALAASTLVRSYVRIKALPANSGVVYVGLSDQVSAATGYPLSAGQELTLDVGVFRVAGELTGDLANVYVIGSAANQAVGYVGF